MRPQEREPRPPARTTPPKTSAPGSRRARRRWERCTSAVRSWLPHSALVPPSTKFEVRSQDLKFQSKHFVGMWLHPDDELRAGSEPEFCRPAGIREIALLPAPLQTSDTSLQLRLEVGTQRRVDDQALKKRPLQQRGLLHRPAGRILEVLCDTGVGV